jgi:hypothetical protein
MSSSNARSSSSTALAKLFDASLLFFSLSASFIVQTGEIAWGYRVECEGSIERREIVSGVRWKERSKEGILGGEEGLVEMG